MACEFAPVQRLCVEEMAESESIDNSADGKATDSFRPWGLPAELLQEPAKFRRGGYLQAYCIVQIGELSAFSRMPNGVEFELQIQEHALPILTHADKVFHQGLNFLV